MKNARSDKEKITITVKMVGLGYTSLMCYGGRVLTVSERLSVIGGLGSCVWATA